ncbi:methylenetetrahydrofolate reductase [NAD(P)H] [Oceanicaulis alexandrii]|uniref:methylenetetrahydrofolate reductase [NAD(P)H] n=1 Tax=Oceanicaulis alexandrii TaxID=153233 RepID=UPI0004206753
MTVNGRSPAQGPKVSFEFFPPKSEEAETKLWSSIARLTPLAPDFVSVTYGAGGSTRDRTHRTVRRIVSETEMAPAAHLTCVSATRDQVDEVIRDYWNAGVRHIVALRGDPPEGLDQAYQPFPNGYSNSADLTAGIKAIGDFEVSVGCYPEKHPDSADWDADLDMLKAKIDAGATRAITQFFFDADIFFRYLERVRKAGIDIPIVPGVMLQPNFKGLVRMAEMCGAHIPDRVHAVYDGLEDDAGTRELVTAHLAAEMCETLCDGGVDAFHFYTLNRAELSLSTCALLGVKPPQAVKAA